MGFFAPLLAVLTLFTTPLALSPRGAVYVTPPPYTFPGGAERPTSDVRVIPRRCETFTPGPAGSQRREPQSAVCTR